MPGAANIICPVDDNSQHDARFFANPANCASYYECVHGEPILMHCYPPLFFDPSIKICNWPELVDCNQPERNYVFYFPYPYFFLRK